LDAEICSPKDETVTCSWLVDWSCNLLSISCVIKESCTPSSNKMCPSTVDCPAETFAIAVFNRYTLVEIAESYVVGVPVGV